MRARAAAEVYGTALMETATLGSAAFRVIGDDGTRKPLPLRRWLRPPATAEKKLLMRAVGPVLDIGCGAGRHLAWLQRVGVPALGIDIAPAAVTLARGQGAAVLSRSIFGPVPGAGTWGSALLLDGNIGIGGRPARLLARVNRLLRPGGTAFVELEAPGVPSRRLQIRLEGDDEVSEWLPWAWVGVDDIEALAAPEGLALADRWSEGRRWFARLRRTRRACTPVSTTRRLGRLAADARSGDVTVSQCPKEDNLSLWR